MFDLATNTETQITTDPKVGLSGRVESGLLSLKSLASWRERWLTVHRLRHYRRIVRRAARYWIGTAHQSGHSSRLRADSGHVLGRRAFLTLDDVELDLLTFAQ